ncbi:hypothetical protein DR996_19300 [Vibrio owensii]|nr:hypothetical protein DR996_19300 [Vibrio owensii]
MHTESAFNPNAVSHKDAIGLMQVMQNGGALEVSKNCTSEEKFHVMSCSSRTLNIDTGAAYLHILKPITYTRCDPKQNKMLLAIAAYNCGLSNLNALSILHSVTCLNFLQK